MTIYYLMVKTHQKTGLKYLCQTIRHEYSKYKGSGIYWRNHLKIHGSDIVTELIMECHGKEELTKWGLYYSTLWNVVDEYDQHGKKTWANLTPESGAGGRTRKLSANKGKVVVKDKDGYTLMIDITDPRYLSGELVSVNKNTIGVKDNNGNQFRVDTNDPRLLTHELTTYCKGKISVKDKDGNTLQVCTDDPRYLSGELVHIAKGKISVRDNDGNVFKVLPDDPRYLSGELVSVASGKVSVKDVNGDSFHVNINDPRYLSGELSFSGGPSKGFKYQKITCPHCGKIGGGPNMSRFHFENCKKI